MRYFGLSLVCFAVLAVSQLAFAQTTPVAPTGYAVITDAPTVNVSGHIFRVSEAGTTTNAPYANVEVNFLSGDNFVASATTDANGAFEVMDLPAGNYTMVAVDEAEGNYGATDVVLTKNPVVDGNTAVILETDFDMILDGKLGQLTHTKYANMLARPATSVSSAAAPATASAGSMGAGAAGAGGGLAGGMGGLGFLGVAGGIAGLVTGITALADNDNNYNPVPVTKATPANK